MRRLDVPQAVEEPKKAARGWRDPGRAKPGLYANQAGILADVQASAGDHRQVIRQARPGLEYPRSNASTLELEKVRHGFCVLALPFNGLTYFFLSSASR